ncbi:MAG: hypothetical protein ABI594_10920 [Ginsengibacter sp.]
MNTIIINNANNKQANVIEELAKLLQLDITVEKHSSSEREAIDASIDDYENGRTRGLEVSIKDFKKMINGLKQDN